MKNKYLNIIISVISFAIILWFLLLNFGAERMPDEIPQVSQWRNFFFRGMFALPALAMLLFLRRKRALEVLLWSICVAATVEAVLGLMQLYGYRFSNHGIFRLTGTFYNPGPLGGYIAVALPVVVYLLIKTAQVYQRKSLLNHWLKYLIITRYGVLGVMLAVMVVVLPSTMSRTGWIAAAISSAFVLYNMLPVKIWIKRHTSRIKIAVVAVVCVSALVGVWKLKSDSALGRLLMWKVSLLAVADSPFVGHSNFAAAFGNAQEVYFSESCNSADAVVAGVPDYAFNEYLHFAVVWGYPLVLLVTTALVLTVIQGKRRGRYGFCGAVMAFMVFSLASYPAHLPAFVAVLIVSLAGCLWPSAIKMRLRILAASLMVSAAVAMFFGYDFYNHRCYSMRRWEKSRWLYNSKLYSKAAESYKAIEPEMKWNPRFLYEYGHSQYKNEDLIEAIYTLEECLKISGDAMVLNVLGECYQSFNILFKAEQFYLRSTRRLPNRMYPHYLLYKLYCQNNYYDPPKRKAQYRSIVSMPVKIKSPAIDEMLNEVKVTEPTLKQRDEEYYHYQNYIRRIPPYFHWPSDI